MNSSSLATNQIYVLVTDNVGSTTVDLIQADLSSKDEIEEYIEQTYPDGAYEYGILKSAGSVSVQTPTKQETLTESGFSRLNKLDRMYPHKEVTQFSKIANTDTVSAKIHGEHVHYKDGQADFSVLFDPTAFNEDLPLNSDEEVKELFNSHFTKERYLGFKSSYGTRGRRDPYVRAVGQVDRGTDRYQTRQTIEKSVSCIDGIYLSKDTFIPLRDLSDTSSSPDETVFVSNHLIQTSFTDTDDILKTNFDEAINFIDQLDAYQSVNVNTIGYAIYKGNYQLAAAVSID